MNFQTGPGVRKHKLGGPYREYIGNSRLQDNRDRRYTMGRWSFNNVVSATVFEYITGMGDAAYAPGVILYMEELLQYPDLKNLSEMGIFDLAEVIPHPTAQAIGKIGNAIKAMGGSIGKLIREETKDAYGSCNPIVVSNKKDYVEYMLAYWGRHPEIGPAYAYWSKDPSLKRNENLPEFKHF